MNPCHIWLSRLKYRMQGTYEVNFETITPEGKSCVVVEEKNIYVEGVLPGESAKIGNIHKKKKYLRGSIVELTKTSPHRIEAREAHCAICSPFQIAEYNYQIELKKRILSEAFENHAGVTLPIEKFYESEKQYGYRTKMEFGFTGEPGSVTLAFNERETWKRKVALPDGCLLGSERVNRIALAIVRVLNEKKVDSFHLKSLILRESKTKNKIIAIVLFTREEMAVPITIEEIGEKLEGLITAHSTYKSPVSIITKMLSQEGIDKLEEDLNGFKIQYSHDSFFQNNLPVYEKALQEIEKATPKSDKIVELYCGIGSIGMQLSQKAQDIFAVESVAPAIEFAKKNAEFNNITNYHPECLLSEKLPEDYMNDTDVLVLDPPRSGLHPKVIKNIIASKPKKIIYLSCNPVTLAQDFYQIQEHYDPSSLMGFDFYPNTPHLEALLVLNLKS
jgi:23S rRNA (uracil1939-C5)-methyltransferase